MTGGTRECESRRSGQTGFGWHCRGAVVIRVYAAQTITMAGNVQNVLEANGIPCVLRNEFLSACFGGLPPILFGPEVWVANDADAERARQLIAEAIKAPAPKTVLWRCRHCGEEVDAIFAQCWNCRAERPE